MSRAGFEPATHWLKVPLSVALYAIWLLWALKICKIRAMSAMGDIRITHLSIIVYQYFAHLLWLVGDAVFLLFLIRL